MKCFNRIFITNFKSFLKLNNFRFSCGTTRYKAGVVSFWKICNNNKFLWIFLREFFEKYPQLYQKFHRLRFSSKRAKKRILLFFWKNVLNYLISRNFLNIPYWKISNVFPYFPTNYVIRRNGQKLANGFVKSFQKYAKIIHLRNFLKSF